MIAPYYQTDDVTLYHGDCRAVMAALADGSVDCCVTSPPYWGLRDYGIDGQLGLEKSPSEYVRSMVGVFDEVRRVLRDEGTLWLNLGDSYAGSWGNYAPGGIKGVQRPRTEAGKRHNRRAYSDTTFKPPTADAPGLKPKDLCGIPWMVAFALREAGWYLRSDIIWHKPNPMPESVTDRPTKAHEYLFLLAKSDRYYYDSDAIRERHATADTDPRRRLTPEQYESLRTNKSWHNHEEDSERGQMQPKTAPSLGHPLGRNRRSVWTVATKPFKGAHFATFPPKLIEPCILAGCPEGGVVLDPFAGAGTTAIVATQHGRRFVGAELNPDYCEIIVRRLKEQAAKEPLLAEAV